MTLQMLLEGRNLSSCASHRHHGSSSALNAESHLGASCRENDVQNRLTNSNLNGTSRAEGPRVCCGKAFQDSGYPCETWQSKGYEGWYCVSKGWRRPSRILSGKQQSSRSCSACRTCCMFLDSGMSGDLKNAEGGLDDSWHDCFDPIPSHHYVLKAPP